MFSEIALPSLSDRRKKIRLHKCMEIKLTFLEALSLANVGSNIFKQGILCTYIHIRVTHIT